MLKAVAFETTVAAVAIGMFLDGRTFGAEERERLSVAAGRLWNALDAGGVR
ncbi:MAG: hypothetical protein GJU67_04435 [Ferrovum sp.]|nr:hypothetical protein [Ferrovum sp.]